VGAQVLRTSDVVRTYLGMTMSQVEDHLRSFFDPRCVFAES
jgi:hypothetical protein